MTPYIAAMIMNVAAAVVAGIAVVHLVGAAQYNWAGVVALSTVLFLSKNVSTKDDDAGSSS